MKQLLIRGDGMEPLIHLTTLVIALMHCMHHMQKSKTCLYKIITITESWKENLVYKCY